MPISNYTQVINKFFYLSDALDLLVLAKLY